MNHDALNEWRSVAQALPLSSLLNDQSRFEKTQVAFTHSASYLEGCRHYNPERVGRLLFEGGDPEGTLPGSPRHQSDLSRVHDHHERGGRSTHRG